jgi:hypothetical protein
MTAVIPASLMDWYHNGHPKLGGPWISPMRGAHFYFDLHPTACALCYRHMPHPAGFEELVRRLEEAASSLTAGNRINDGGSVAPAYSGSELNYAFETFGMSVPAHLQKPGAAPLTGPGSASDSWPGLARKMLACFPNDEKQKRIAVVHWILEQCWKVDGKAVTEEQANALWALYAPPRWKKTR